MKVYEMFSNILSVVYDFLIFYMVFYMNEICILGNYIDYSKIMNEDCGTLHELSVLTTEVHIKTEDVNNIPVQSAPSLKVALGN